LGKPQTNRDRTGHSPGARELSLGLVSIGEFSWLSRLSPKALRLDDELGLLVPEHVDAATGYRWYADTQLDQARVAALLRRIGVPLAQIRDLLAVDSASAAEQIRAYWAEIEREHAAQRELAGYLVDRLHGKKPAMYEVAVRDIPARSLLSLMRRAHQDELIEISREFFIHRMARGGVAQVEGIAGGPFTIYYGEVSGDSDGPVEFCWPVPDDQAAEIAARFPDLTPPHGTRARGGVRRPGRARDMGQRNRNRSRHRIPARLGIGAASPDIRRPGQPAGLQPR
jgi:DNA-binding transcriptional MerR regulator